MKSVQDVCLNNQPSCAIESTDKAIRAWSLVRWDVLDSLPNLLFTQAVVKLLLANRRQV